MHTNNSTLETNNPLQASKIDHAMHMLDSMYRQSLKHDLIKDGNDAARDVLLHCSQDGIFNCFNCNATVIDTDEYCRAYLSCTSTHACTGDGSLYNDRISEISAIFAGIAVTKSIFTFYIIVLVILTHFALRVFLPLICHV